MALTCDHPQLSLGRVGRTGLFAADGPYQVSFFFVRPLVSVQLRLFWQSWTSELVVEAKLWSQTSQNQVSRALRVSPVKSGATERLYFRCDQCLRLARALYLRGPWACRECHGLRYPSQRGLLDPDAWQAAQAYFHDRERALEVAENGEIAKSWDDPFPKADTTTATVSTLIPRGFAKECRQRAKRRQGAKPFSTASGLAYAQAQNLTASDAEALALDLWRRPAGEHPLDVIAEEPLDRSTPTGLVEDYPSLDIRTLASEGLLGSSATRWAALSWPSIQGLERLYLWVDAPDPDNGSLVLIFDWDGGAVRRKFRLAKGSGPRARQHLLCRHSGRPVQMLIFRNGRFAPRELQRLVHGSQRKGRTKGGENARPDANSPFTK